MEIVRIGVPLFGRGPGTVSGSGAYPQTHRSAPRDTDHGQIVARLRFSHTCLDRGGAEGDLMELNGWASPQMLQRYGGSARSARARRHYDLIMRD